ncbi:MAG: hypothetical protein J6U17_03305, partial [Kiritimatiellae bacterium]|nr:hypothetical protein [Kiritimatiellia bacterium]
MSVFSLMSLESLSARALPPATIISEFLFCESAQGEDSKEKKGCGGKEEGRKNPFVNFGTKALQA